VCINYQELGISKQISIYFLLQNTALPAFYGQQQGQYQGLPLWPSTLCGAKMRYPALSDAWKFTYFDIINREKEN
jgi:hypothetical protein